MTWRGDALGVGVELAQVLAQLRESAAVEQEEEGDEGGALHGSSKHCASCAPLSDRGYSITR